MSTSSEAFFRNGQISCIVWQSAAFIVCVIILFHEFRNHNRLTLEEKQSDKFLHLIALFSLLSSTFSQMLCALSKFPSTILQICPFTIHLGFFLYWSKYVFLGLFQIKRLDYIAKTEAVVVGSSKLSLIVKLLYIGALITSIGCIIMTVTLVVTDYGQYGCTLTYSPLAIILNFPMLILYLFWDVSTLIVFIVKLSQYRQTVRSAIEHSKAADSDDQTLHKDIVRALSKTILLTLIYEVSFSVYAILGMIIGVTLNEYLVILGYFWIATDGVIAVLVVFLFQKHNKKQYDVVLMLLYKCGLLMCCNRLAVEANETLNSHIKQLGLGVSTSNSSDKKIRCNMK
eukprot:408931_1